jgi:hypothetical protein
MTENQLGVRLLEPRIEGCREFGHLSPSRTATPVIFNSPPADPKATEKAKAGGAKAY